MAVILNGREVANRILEDLKEKDASKHLFIIQCNDRKDSDTYIRMKMRACQKLGISCDLVKFPIDVQQDEVLAKIDELNKSEEVTGILVQLPLVEHLDPDVIINRVDPQKDVDGLNIQNTGNLFLRDHTPIYEPCTPRGIIALLDSYNIGLKGKHVVVVGCSNIVGRPLSMMLLKRDATVTICHISTKNIKKHTRMADILVVATGVPGLVTEDWIDPMMETVVIDVGINHIKDDSRKSGTRLVGDVAFDEVSKVCSAITPVPGGVGPLTVAMLMTNLLQ